MISDSASATMAVRVEVADEAEIQWLDGEIREAVALAECSLEEESSGRLVDPLSVMLYVATGYAIVNLVTDVADRIRRRGQSFVIVDYRSEVPQITVRQDVPEMKGRVLIIGREGERHELTREDLGDDAIAVIKGLLPS